MAPEVPPAAPAAPRPAAPAISPYDIAQEARAASRGGMGSQAATQRLAAAAAPDPETVAAAQRLGIAEHLQPGHVTTSQSYRALEQVLRSIPGSALRAQEVEGLKAVSSRATQLLDDMGAMPRSELSAAVNKLMKDNSNALRQAANNVYKKIEELIPGDTPASAPRTLALIDEQIKKAGGNLNLLSPMEKSLLENLNPRTVGNQTTTPTFGALDILRKQASEGAFSRSGPFMNEGEYLLGRYSRALADDIGDLLVERGYKEYADLAKAAWAMKKSIDDDLVSLFGREISGSMLSKLDRAFQNITKGDFETLRDFIKAVPKEMRQEVMATGLATAFNKAALDGSLNFKSYYKWWEGLERNRQAKALIMSNLPSEAQQQLRDLAKVSKGISLSLDETIKTGRLGTGVDVIRDQLQPADTLAQRVFQVAQRSAVGAPLEVLTAGMGMPGTGLAAGITSALMKTGKSEPLKAADTLLASPEFQSMAKATVEQSAPKMEQAARRMAQSRAFQDFAEKAAAPRELSAATQWIMSATQAAQNLRPEQTQ
jgi:hypothetical protein